MKFRTAVVISIMACVSFSCAVRRTAGVAHTDGARGQTETRVFTETEWDDEKLTDEIRIENSSDGHGTSAAIVLVMARSGKYEFIFECDPKYPCTDEDEKRIPGAITQTLQAGEKISIHRYAFPCHLHLRIRDVSSGKEERFTFGFCEVPHSKLRKV